MRLLTTISLVAALGGSMTGAALAQSTAQTMAPPTETAQAAPDTTAPAPPPAVGDATAIPDQVSTAPAGGAVVTHTVTNGPVPDTPANRARFGGPMSHAGKKTAPGGN